MALAAGLCCLYTGIGSGGNIVNRPKNLLFEVPTGSFISVPVNETKAPEDIKSVADMLTDIKVMFGLNISQLSNVLLVERQTIYNWKEDPRTPQPNKLERLKKIYTYAVRWNQLCSRPLGQWLKIPVNEGMTLLDLLSSVSLDERVIHQVISTVSTRINEESNAKKERSVAERLKRNGLEPPLQNEFRDSLTVYSDKVFTTES